MIFIRNFSVSSIFFAGHSKWANIRHIKALKDGQKAVIFAKYARQIRLAIQEGKSANPSVNSSLKNVVDMALKNNMPNGNIQNVIKKYSTPSAATELKKLVLEMKWNRAAAICVFYTDNTSHTKQTTSTHLRKTYGSLTDCKGLFEETGLIEAISNHTATPDELLEKCTDDAIESGAEDVEVLDESTKLVLFRCAPEYIEAVKNKLIGKGYSVENASHEFMPKQIVSVPPEDRKLFNNFCERMKTVEGFDEIFHNLSEEE